MAFTLPNLAVAAFPDQARPGQTDMDALVLGYAQTGVKTGCAVTAQASPDMTVAVASGTVYVAGSEVAVTGGNVTITTAHATLPRKDIVVVSNAGAKSVTAGTAAAVPVAPAIPATSAILAEVYVPAADTAINSTQITDKRVVILLPAVGGTLLTAYKTADQTKTSDATVANDADMLLAVVSNGIYAFDFMFVMTYGVGSPVDTAFTFNRPTSATGWFRGNSTQIGVETSAADTPFSNVLGTTATDIAANSGGTNLQVGFGILVVAGTSGNLNFAWAQSSSSTLGNTLKKGSWLRAIRLA